MKTTMETEAIDRLFLELAQVTQATTVKELALQSELALLREAVGIAYGHLWMVNNEHGTPGDIYTPERAAYEARKMLRDTMTHKQRGEFINRVFAQAHGLGA